MRLINCDISLILTSSKNCFLVTGTAANQESTFTISDTKLYVSVRTLSTPDNEKLLKQLDSDFKRTINWNNHQYKIKYQAQNRYLYFLIDASFQWVSRLFALSFEDNVPKSYKQYFFPTVEI